jgi:hypothetical protein
MVTLPQLLLPACTDRGSHQCSLSKSTPLPCTCCSAVQVSVCTVLLPILGRLTYRGLQHRQTVGTLHLLSVSVCNMFLAPYFISTASPCAAIPFSPLSSPLDSHSNVSSVQTSYLTHQTSVNLLSHFSFKDSPTFPSPSSFLSPFSFDNLILLLTSLLF